MRAPLILLAGLALAACDVPQIGSNQTVANINSQAEARQLVKPGMTMDQVTAILGKSGGIHTSGAETEWVYAAGTTAFNPVNVATATWGFEGDTKQVFVFFNASNRVTRVDYAFSRIGGS